MLVFDRLDRHVEKAEIPAGRHKIDDFDHLKFLAPQYNFLPQLRLLVLINDCAGVVAPLDYVADFINRRHHLAADKMLVAKLERQIRGHISHNYIAQMIVGLAHLEKRLTGNSLHCSALGNHADCSRSGSVIN
jgi:hypothetical protein